MAATVEKRRLLLSWREGMKGIGDWIVLVKRMFQHQARGVTCIDVREPGSDRRKLQAGRGQVAEDREWDRDYSDLLSVLTLEYVEACEREHDHEMLYWITRYTRLWVLRVQAGDPADFHFRHGERDHHPWEDPRWHSLPPPGMPYLSIDEGTDTPKLRTETLQHCVEPIDKHQDCEACLQIEAD